MRKWISILLVVLFFIGCDDSNDKNDRLIFSILIPQTSIQQSVHYVDGKQIFTSVSKDSAVSAMIINNPIPAGKEAVVAIAIQNLENKKIDLKWSEITFFNPKSHMKLLSVAELENYFKQPDRCKPILNIDAFKPQMKKYGVIQDPSKDTLKKELLPTETALAKVYRAMKKDLCYTKLPNDTSLDPHGLTVGYMVIRLPAENFEHRIPFMLKIPVAQTVHKLRYILQPLK